jgi:hypothetical protein
MLDRDGDSKITEDEVYASCQQMDWNYDGYLSIEEFLYGVEVLHSTNLFGICQNEEFMSFFSDELYDPEFRTWGEE